MPICLTEITVPEPFLFSLYLTQLNPEESPATMALVSQPRALCIPLKNLTHRDRMQAPPSNRQRLLTYGYLLDQRETVEWDISNHGRIVRASQPYHPQDPKQRDPQDIDNDNDEALYVEAELQVFMEAVNGLGCDVGMRTRGHLVKTGRMDVSWCLALATNRAMRLPPAEKIKKLLSLLEITGEPRWYTN